MADVPVEIWQVVRDDEGHDVVLLRDAQGRLLPIAIGICEAAAIWVRLAPDLAAPFVRRPWSHDLMHALLERLGAQLERVVIDDYSTTSDIFFATLHVRYRGEELVIDARPSDAIALVLRMPAPLFVRDDVMNDASILPSFPDNGDDTDTGEEPM